MGNWKFGDSGKRVRCPLLENASEGDFEDLLTFAALIKS